VPGFTLTEALVVVSIVGLLAAVLLPAVQSARESARRAQCLANLKQLGIALNDYCSLHGMFPPGELVNRSGVANASEYSPLTFLLPNLEQTALFNAINMRFAGVESAEFPTIENRTARNTRVAFFLCPSDGEPHHGNSYRFNRGRYGVVPGDDGPFGAVTPRPSAITDGLSRTAFVSERLGGSFLYSESDRIRDVKYSNINAGVIASDEEFIPICLAAEPELWQVESGRYWLYTGNLNTHYNHNGTPNDRRPSCGNGFDRNFNIGLHPPRSHHPGGVHVLFGDGRVQLVKDEIQPRLWIAMGTHASGD
jgi:prepilin-type N-terminal cleavage/methylation domain-containing protein/prepilin-type processing-associated H-X9-DG protein